MKKINGLMYLLLSLLLLFTTGCPPFPVIISSPHNGAHFEVGKEIPFAGSARDFQEGELTGGSLVWTSDQDGQIGEGNSFTRDDLSAGKHKITLTATNSQDEERTMSITITIGEGTTTTSPTTTTSTMLEISGALEIDKIIGPLMVSMEAELMIPFHVEGTEIVSEGGPWMTPISGNDVPDSFGCTVDFTGEFDIRDVGGKLVTTDPNNPFLYFTFEVYETEYWTRTCPDGVFNDKWVSEWWESDCGMDLVDGYTWGGPPTKFLYTLHLNTTP
jgi:hypothetical protein